MKAIVRYNDGTPTKVTQVPIPVIQEQHIIIKVMACVINPADEYYYHGIIPTIGTSSPMICGMEGSGVIEEIGEVVPNNFIKGMRVSFCSAIHPTQFSTGSWAQYALVHYDCCMPFGDSLKFEEMAGSLVNSLTISQFLYQVEQGGHKALVNTAAASALGKMLIKYCNKKEIELISIVRREEQVQMLKEIGAKCVLNSSNKDFEEEFRETAAKLSATIAYDCIAGDFSAVLIQNMPPFGQLFLYGNLSGQPLANINPLEFIFYHKTINGSEVLSFIQTHPQLTQTFIKQISAEISEGNNIFHTIPAQFYKLDDIKEAIVNFKKTATKGKSIFQPNL